MAAVFYLSAAFVLFSGSLFSESRTENILCPSSCSCLGFLVDCSKRGLIEIPKDLPTWVQILELQENDITEIRLDTFEGLINLQQLDMSNNKMTFINGSVFLNLPALRDLKIQYNLLSEIPNLNSHGNLSILSLHHNQIHSIAMSSLEGLVNLRTLDLNYNKIFEITVGTFPNSTKLHQLYLNNNKIVNFEKGCLDNLTSLEWLKLNKNKLSFLPKDLFRKLGHVKYLELNRNKFRVIEGLAFHGLESLHVLKIRRNQIANLLDGSFWGLSSIQNLQLDYNNITTMTKGWLYGLNSLQQLSLSHNNIESIEPDGWEFCQQLWELDLTHNNLVAIREGTFSKLQSLQYLYLDHNKISLIEDGAFRGLSSLQILELNKNEISWTIEDMNGAFAGLQQLNRLGLDNNHIKSIAKRAFTGLDGLKQLDLTDNAITSIQSNAFSTMKTLQELHFNSTTLLCDCQLRWLPEWLTLSGFQNSVNAKCGHPEWLKGQSIFSINSEDFTCDDFPKPYITQEPETRIALKSSNTTLVCTAASSSDSRMEVQWKKDNVLVNSNNIVNYAQTKDGTLTELTSILRLSNVQDEDEGRYQCIITNHFGSAYSQKARITVHVFPAFTKIPVDVTLKAGTTARLECAAKGQPKPEIAWQKDGGVDFPAARERRMHVMPTDDVFFIVNVKSSDMGVYSCTAQNAAGTIMANTTVTVLETPSFVKPMEDREARAGETAVMECMASGSPKPKLTWTKDGGPLIATERHFFTADNQLLIIVQAQPSDAGKYTCEMSNTLGTERGFSILTVIPVSSAGLTSSGLDDESTTTGIIIIAVVCCVVGTSLIWVIIIYQTRKKNEDLNTDHSPKKGIGDSGKSHGFIAELEPNGHHVGLTDEQHAPAIGSTGNSISSFPLQDTDSSVDTLTSTPSTGTTNSGDTNGRSLRTFHPRPTNHERIMQTVDGSVTMPSVDIVVHMQPIVPAGEMQRWPASEVPRWPTRSQSHELPSELCEQTEQSGSPRDILDVRLQGLFETVKDLGFATFPRIASPSVSQAWSTGSLRYPKFSKDVQNDSGSFSIESESRPYLESRIASHNTLLQPSPSHRFSASSLTDQSPPCMNIIPMPRTAQFSSPSHRPLHV